MVILDVPVVGQRRGGGQCVEVLEHFRLNDGETAVSLGRPAERLVAYLSLQDITRSRDQVAGSLWPESVQSKAAANLRRALSLVLQCVPGLILTGHQNLTLAPTVEVDARRQRRLIDDVTLGTSSAGFGGSDLHLLRGDLLPGWDEPWLTAWREELRQLRLLALEALASAHLAQGRPDPALSIALSAVRVDPLRESAHRLVVQAHLAHGNGVDAARHYAAYRLLLWSELRLHPGEQMELLVGPLSAVLGGTRA
jgi:DNA-binding SARP family transcriptional activator